KNSVIEVYVVITNPLGQVVQNNIWESGYFSTRAGAKTEFTVKLKFEYNKGEQKRLIYSLDQDNFLKGVYKMRVYHNSVLIGETTRKLS
ncbi:MAG: hypothetical protein M3O67_02380, partial [Bacteroidota bacterium]|nr:hypothetical protein [Bacteroidota bacterium]